MKSIRDQLNYLERKIAESENIPEELKDLRTEAIYRLTCALLEIVIELKALNLGLKVIEWAEKDKESDNK